MTNIVKLVSIKFVGAHFLPHVVIDAARNAI